MELTPRQLAAVAVQQTDQDTCVVAGPGSGKTTVLVEHFERLVASGKDPLRILTITFTDKAANNMREKLARTFQDRAEIRSKIERAYVSTVHAFCARLLKENAIYAGIDPDFYVMDERESLRVERQVVDETLDAMFAEQPERMRALMRGLATTDAGAALLDVYDAIRAAGVGIGELTRYPAPPAVDVAGALEQLRQARPRDWRLDQLAHLDEAREAAERIAAAFANGAGPTLRAIAEFAPNLRKLQRNNTTYDLVKRLKQDLLPALEYWLISEYYAAERGAILELLARFDRMYRERKQQLGGLDYDDLEEYSVRLLEDHADVQRRVRNQFDQVLMDEFQDTNGQQAKLLRLLRPPDRFYAVGDINQSIYGFRHAEPEVFRDYRDQVERAGQRLVELVENFRSRPDILRWVEAVTDGAAGIERRPLVPGLTFADKAAPSVEVLAAKTLDVEAQWVAARLVELEGRLEVHGRPAEFRDFAVLVRNSEVMGELTAAFDGCGIPYLVSRGKGFYETREVVDLMHLLRVVVNPRDEISMAAVLRSPFVEASDEALLRLKTLGNLGSAVERLSPDSAASLATDDAAKLERFRDQLVRWRELRFHAGIDQLLLRALDECGYQCPTGARGAANIEKFLAQARTAGARQTLAEFVAEIEMLRASQPREPDAPPEDSANAVKIMTVHSAKGLEFPIVFLAAMHKGMDSGPGAIAFLPRIGLGACWRHPAGGRDKSDALHHQIREALTKREEEEGNRLLYVAMTRAEEHLVLSFSTNGKKPQHWAAVVQASLNLDFSTPRDEIVVVGQAPVRVRSVDAPPPRPERREQVETAAPVQILQRPILTEQHDAQANVTSIAMFAGCPRRYFLSRYLGFDPKARARDQADGDSDLSASEFGRQVHALLAGTVVESPDPEAAKLAEVFRKSALGGRADAAGAAEREFDFLMEIENLVLRGQIDLWFDDGGKTVLVDYKTDQVSAAEAPARAERYALQLRLYALALERLTGRPPAEAYLYFLRPNLPVAVDLRPSLFNAPEPLLREFREAQASQRFPLRVGDHCRSCPHFTRLCPAMLSML